MKYCGYSMKQYDTVQYSMIQYDAVWCYGEQGKKDWEKRKEDCRKTGRNEKEKEGDDWKETKEENRGAGKRNEGEGKEEDGETEVWGLTTMQEWDFIWG